MKTTILSLTVAAASLLSVSCQNYATPQQNNAATGALIGSAVGAATGDDGREVRRNAIIGAAAGGAGGYLLGQQEQRRRGY